MLSSVIDVLLTVTAVLLAIPCLVFVLECLAGIMAGDHEPALPVVDRQLRRAVLISAHNEESGLANTLRTVLPQLSTWDVCLVVADNCSDHTAAIARAHGVWVVERSHPTERGKGYALAFGLDCLARNPPDVVIIVDADITLRAGSVDALASIAWSSRRAVQADNVVSPKIVTPLAAISAFAFLVRNRVRARGLRRLGLPCHLTGTGMAFAWDVVQKASPTRASLVEDLTMGLELARLGHAPLYTSLAGVHSLLPEKGAVARQQRTRWEHGQLTTARAKALPLLQEGIAKRRLDLIAFGLDLTVPPLALLMAILLAAWLVMLVALWLSVSVRPFAIVSVCGFSVGLTIMLTWLRFGRATLPARYLLAIPLYLVWKLPVYATYFRHGCEKNWQRTDRPPEETLAASPFVSRVEDEARLLD